MNKEQFLKDLFILAAACEYELDAKVANLYADVLEPYGWGNVYVVLRDFQIKAKKFKFPSIGEFTEILDPPINGKTESIEAANRIIEAVGKYGHSNPIQAEKHIGELGWLMVEKFGGWADLCSKLNNQNEGMFRAQLRELGETVIYRERQGRREIPPALSDIVKPLAEKKEMKKLK